MKCLLIFCAALLSSQAFAKTMAPMNFVEKSSYALQKLVNQHRIDASFLTDVSAEKINASASGAVIELDSPSANPQVMNTLTLTFDASGTLTSYNADFKSVSAASPIFHPTNAGTILDLGAEAVVDHLNESPDLPVVAATAQALTIDNEGTGFHIRILLQDGRTYNILMDDQANVVGKGF